MNKSYGFWRKTSVTIPRKGQRVLVWNNNLSYMCVGFFNAKCNVWSELGFIEDVSDMPVQHPIEDITHWMYLPPAPKIRIRQLRRNP